MSEDRAAAELLDDEEIRAVLSHLARRTPPDLCPRCAQRQLASGADMCAVCDKEVTESERATKRRSYHRAVNTTAPPTKRAACRTWLTAQFHGRPVPGERIRIRARKAGFTRATLRRAADDVGIDYLRHADGTTSWVLPPKAERDVKSSQPRS